MTDINWEFFFKVQDFEKPAGLGPLTALDVVELANTKIWAVIQCQEKIFGSDTNGAYHGVPNHWCARDMDNNRIVTHEARIIDIRKLK